MESHFNPQICSRGILSKKFEDFNDNLSNDSSSTISSINEEDEEEDEVNSSSPSSPLQNMSSLLQQLPFKRGLSKHYNGKSQSFTSLTQVGCLEDLAKPENPYNKKLKTCKSYGVFPRNNNTTICSRQIERRESNNNRGSHFGNSRPPTIPTPYRSASTSNFTNQTPLFI